MAESAAATRKVPPRPSWVVSTAKSRGPATAQAFPVPLSMEVPRISCSGGSTAAARAARAGLANICVAAVSAMAR
jgi:hypothetical protein